MSVSENIRFLLWQAGIEKPYWKKSLKSKLNSIKASGFGSSLSQLDYSTEDCDDLLLRDNVSETDLRVVSQAFAIDESELKFSSLLKSSKTNVLAHNLKTLCSGLGPGGKTKLAESLGVHNTTLSRWLSGTITPDKIKLKNLSDFFGVDYDKLLNDHPYFLSINPVTEIEKRDWLKSRVDDIPRELLNRLYPALDKLLN
ncbi:helix-turn-helix domain-containing protein [Shewanella sp. 10N.286.51.B8]|uniref:helix-turn-helix domain-containing protein n=1 Tax=Shewanella sp. 10N.286.51.B8 TaxID=3229708 RepID=UPI00354D3747